MAISQPGWKNLSSVVSFSKAHPFPKERASSDTRLSTTTHFSISSTCKTTKGKMAFERVCLQHVSQIKYALGIGAVISTTHTWKSDPKKREEGEKGAQIDLLIDRNDKTICILIQSRMLFPPTSCLNDNPQNSTNNSPFSEK